MKLAAVLPAALTFGNGLSGFAAIILLATGPAAERLPLAAALIFLAWSFDMVDGLVARRLGVDGPFGAILDTLCDAISFGLLPATLVHLSVAATQWWWAGALVGGAYLVGVLGRLARFSVAAMAQKDQAPSRFRIFEGLPATAAAMAAAAGILSGFPHISPLIGVIIAPLMLSRLPYPDLAQVYLSRGLPWWHGVPVLAAGLAYGAASTAAGVLALYVILGPVLAKHLLKRAA